MKDCCVICNNETRYDFTDHIDMRYGYVEGVGQLCNSCFNCSEDNNHICVPSTLITKTPNDFELGEKVRSLFWKNK